MTFSWSQITIIIPAYRVESARELGAALDPAGAGMYTTGLSPDGNDPATHYISSGMIDSMMVYLLSDSKMLYKASEYGAYEQGIELDATQDQADSLVSNAFVSYGDPWEAIQSMGLQMIKGSI